MAEYSIEAVLKANASKFKKAIETARDVTEKFKRESESVEDTELDADIKPLRRNIRKARKLMQAFTKSKNEVNVDADTSEATRKMGKLMAVKQALERSVTLPIKVEAKNALRKLGDVKAGIELIGGEAIKNLEKRIRKFQKTIGRMANFMQSFATVIQSMIGGIALSFSSVLVPVIASLVPAIMAVGNAVGVLTAGVAGLGASFGIAGGLAAGFGAAAIPTIKSIADGTAEATKVNQKATKQLKSLTSAWKGVTEAIAPDVAKAFTNAMSGAEKAVKALQPAIEFMADSVVKLSKQFNNFMDTKIAKEFFDMIHNHGVNVFHNLATAVGRFGKGFITLLTAFGPAIQDVSQGFQNMGTRFAEWSAMVAKSDGLQNFIDYVKTNLPTIQSIFGNVFQGIINLFVAFGKNSSLIFDSLSKMTKRFKTWSATIAESDGFQKFIQYVQKNGPKVIDLIGNIINFIINLGVALAPLGAKMLSVANGFLQWANSMMKNHPIIGKLIALGTVLGGALMALVPFITMVVTAFSGFGTAIMKVIPWVLRIGKFLLGLSNPIGLVITIVTTLAAVIIANWDKIWTWTKSTFNKVRNMMKVVWAGIKITVQTIAKNIMLFIKTAWQAIKNTTQTVWTVITTLIKTAWNNIKTGVKVAIQAVKNIIKTAWNVIKAVTTTIWNGIKTVFKTVWNTMKSTATSIGNAIKSFVTSAWNTISSTTSAVWNGIRSFFSSVWNGIQSIFTSVVNAVINFVTNAWNNIKSTTSSVFNSVKSTISNVWNSIKSFISNTVSSIFDTISNTFSNIADAVSDSINNVREFISDGLNKALDFVKGMGSDFLSAGKGLIDQMAKGVKQAGKKVVDSAKNLVGKVRNLLPFSPAKEGPLSDLDKLDFGGPIKDSIERAKRPVRRSAEKLASAAKITPTVEQSQITSSLKGLQRKSRAQVQSGVNANVNVSKQPIQIIVRNEADAEWIRTYVNEGNAIDNTINKF